MNETIPTDNMFSINEKYFLLKNAIAVRIIKLKVVITVVIITIIPCPCKKYIRHKIEIRIDSAKVNSPKIKILYGYFDPKHPIAHIELIVVTNAIAKTFLFRTSG